MSESHASSTTILPPASTDRQVALRSLLRFWAKALLIALMAAAAYCMATPGDPFFYQAF